MQIFTGDQKNSKTPNQPLPQQDSCVQLKKPTLKT